MVASEEQHGKDRLAIENFAGVDLGKKFRERDGMKGDLFVLLGLGGAGAEVFGEEDLHGLGEEAGAGVVADQARPAAGAEASLFNELAFGGGEGGFAGFDAACGELKQKLSGGVTILALEQDGGVVGVLARVHGEDDDGAVVADDVAGAGDATGLGDLVGDDGEDLALEADFGLKDGDFGFGRAGGCFGWEIGDFRHGGTVSFCVGPARGGIQRLAQERTHEL